MTNEIVLLCFAILFLCTTVALLVLAVDLKDRLDLEKSLHRITTFHLENLKSRKP